MKRIIAALLASTILFCFAACGNSHSEVTEKNNESTTKKREDIKIYPLTTTERDFYKYDDIPDVIFTTSGEENGLVGNIYSFYGTMVGKPEKDIDYPCFVVKDLMNDNEILILNYYEVVKETVPLDESYYAVPEIGEVAKFTCIYDGYSKALDLPTFFYGNDENSRNILININNGEDVENEEVATTKASKIEPTVFEGTGDKVISDINLAEGRYKVHSTYTGDGVFSVACYDSDDRSVLSEFSYKSCEKESILRNAKFPLVMEISADGSWKIEFEQID